MSAVIDAGPEVDQANAEGLTSSKNWPTHLRRAYKWGMAALIVQFIVFLKFSNIEAAHFNLEQDFSQFGQAWYLIAHGHWNAFLTIKGRDFYKDHSAFFFYGFAPLWYIWPHTETLMWVQDFFCFVAEAAAFKWMCEFIFATKEFVIRTRQVTFMVGLGASLLFFNPFIFWTIANDFHTEVFSVTFLMLAARAFYHEKKIAWVWLLGVVSTGNVGDTYVVGLALSMILVGQHMWKYAVGALVVAFAGTEFSTLIGGDRGSDFAGYAYIGQIPGAEKPNSAAQVAKLIVKNPFGVVAKLWSHSLAGFVDVSVPGLLGIVSPWVVGVIAVAMVENGVNAWPILTPSYSFQNYIEFIFVPVGTIMVAVRVLLSHRAWARKAMKVGLAAIVIWMAGWALIWLPETPSRWITDPSSSAHILAEIQASIPQGDEVVSSQGVIGNFSTRQYAYFVGINKGNLHIRVETPVIYFIITPNIGIELQTVSDAYRMMTAMEQVPGMQLVRNIDGVYEFRWQVPPTYRKLVLEYANAPIDATLLNSTGAPSSCVIPTGTPNYVVHNDYFILSKPEWFSFQVRLRSDGPLTLEAWDITRDVLLRRMTLVGTNGQSVLFHVRATDPKIVGQAIFNGIWPFQSQVELPRYFGDAVELRIFDPGTTSCSISYLNMTSQFPLQVNPSVA